MRMAEERNRSCSLPFHASWPIRTVQRLPYTFADPMPKGKGNTSELVKTQETAPTKTWGCPAASSSPIPSKKQNKREKACESHATSCWQFGEAAVLSKNTRSLLPGCFWMVFVITNTSWWSRGGRGQPECRVLSQQPDSRWALRRLQQGWHLQHASFQQKGGAPGFAFPSSGWHGGRAEIIHLASRKESREWQINHTFSWEPSLPRGLCPQMMAGIYTILRGSLINTWHQRHSLSRFLLEKHTKLTLHFLHYPNSSWHFLSLNIPFSVLYEQSWYIQFQMWISWPCMRKFHFCIYLNKFCCSTQTTLAFFPHFH